MTNKHSDEPIGGKTGDRPNRFWAHIWWLLPLTGAALLLLAYATYNTPPNDSMPMLVGFVGFVLLFAGVVLNLARLAMRLTRQPDNGKEPEGFWTNLVLALLIMLTGLACIFGAGSLEELGLPQALAMVVFVGGFLLVLFSLQYFFKAFLDPITRPVGRWLWQFPFVQYTASLVVLVVLGWVCFEAYRTLMERSG